MSFTVVITCPEHPLYTAERPADETCSKCQSMYECRRRLATFEANETSWIPVIYHGGA